MHIYNQDNVQFNATANKNSAEAIFIDGTNLHKQSIYNYLSKTEINLLETNKIYTHDSSFFDITLNCCSISLCHIFKDALIIDGIKLEQPKTIFDVFSQLIIFVTNLENEISGGLTLVNFDYELDNLINELKLEIPTPKDLLHCLKMFFQTINYANGRFGHQPPYISLSIGIFYNQNAAMICNSILAALYEGAGYGKPYLFPNVHFRVKQGINKNPTDPFYKQYEAALKVTARQMNPTYILADSEINKNIDPLHLHVVGCRSRLLLTRSDIKYGIGRTNIGAISLNLPGIAMNVENIDIFIHEVKKIMDKAASILLKKSEILKKQLLINAPILRDNNLLYPFDNNILSVIKEASLAIGFIGASEMCEVLFSDHTIREKHHKINYILQSMKDYCDILSIKYNRIFTLIGVSGEGISYHFAANEQKNQHCSVYEKILAKGYYTNSFHVPVFELINPVEKLYLEGKHHKFCNGGCISYVEISHVQDNIEGFADLISIAEANNIHYLGFNFERDICNNCGMDINAVKQCLNCGSEDIIQIRRVSGYLGYLHAFNKGKKLEEKQRIRHTKVREEGDHSKIFEDIDHTSVNA